MLYYGKIYHIDDLSTPIRFLEHRGLIYIVKPLTQKIPFKNVINNLLIISKNDILTYVKRAFNPNDDIVIGGIKNSGLPKRFNIHSCILIQNLSLKDNTKDLSESTTTKSKVSKSHIRLTNRCYKRYKYNVILTDLIPPLYIDEYIIRFGNFNWLISN